MPLPTAPPETSPVTSKPQETRAAAKRMRIARKSWGQWWVSPSEVWWVDGECLPLPVLVRVQAGRLGTPASGGTSTSDAYQTERNKRIPVPLDFKVKAWGEEVKHTMVRMVVGTDAHGKELEHFHDAWTRYRQIGHEVIEETDHDGFKDFCRRCLKLTGPIDQAIAAASRSKAVVLMDSMITADTAATKREAARIEKNITPNEGKKPA